MSNSITNFHQEELQRVSRQHLWYPFTQMQELEREPMVVIESAQGCWLQDTSGKRYLDAVGSIWTNVHGHCHPHIDEALRRQLDRVAHSTLLGLSNVPAIECARKLMEILPPGLERIFYSDNGSTAMEVALKMAFQYHQQTGQPQRTRFLALSGAYHGDTIGSVSLGGIDLFHALYRPLLFEVEHVPAPNCYRCPCQASFPGCRLACLDVLERALEQDGQTIAALVLEPLVQGAAGMLVHPPGYLKGAHELCQRHGVLLIADEVAVGFGKTGRMFACEHEGVVPDIMAIAKGITGGYLPLAATVTTDRVYQAFLGEFAELRTFFHGHTFTGNPLACAAAIATMEVFEQERTLEQLPAKIARLAAGLAPLKAHSQVGDVRQRGTMVGIELVRDKASKEPYDYRLRMGQRVTLEARRRGVFTRPLGNVVVLMPPLSITTEEIDLLCQVIGESIAAATSS